jgi:Zn-dependent peptidase ImmA (M78 family)
MLIRGHSRTPERAARQVLDAWWDGSLPVNPRKIAMQQSTQVKASPQLDVSGIVSMGEDGAPVIQVNATESNVRQRFTIAHELGHVMLEHLTPEKQEFRDPKQNYALGNFDPRQRDANRFTAMLLMPPKAVHATPVKQGNTRGGKTGPVV